MRAFLRWVPSLAALTLGARAYSQNYTYTLVADTTGPYADFITQTFPPSIANNGAVTYHATIDASAGKGIYYWDGSSTHTVKFDPTVGGLTGFFGPPNLSDDGLSVIMKDRFGTWPRIEGWTLGFGAFLIYDQNPTPYNNVQLPDMSQLGEACFVATGSGNSGLAKGWIGTFSTAEPGTMQQYSRINAHGDFTYLKVVSGVSTLYKNSTPLESTNATLFAIDEDMGMTTSGLVGYVCRYTGQAEELVIHDGIARTSAVHTSGPYRNIAIGNHGPAINSHGNYAFFGTTDSSRTGVFAGPNPLTDSVIANGDIVLGGTVTAVNGFWSGGLNDSGELVMGVTYSGGTKAIIKATPAAVSISGHVTLLDYVGSTMPVVDIDMLGPSPETHLAVPLDPAGNFTFTTTRRGSYEIRVKAWHWLAEKSLPVTIWHSGASGLSFALLNGDCDGDNEVAIGDYALLSSAYNSFPGDFNWDPSADLNGDEEVSISDYAILSQNFGEFGD